jgi:predicted Rossmann fold flavoprotein
LTSASGATLPDACDVAIVGAGAAGLATAIFARRQNRDRSVVVLDGARRPGAKILVSGGGRCNVTNAVVTERDFWGGPRTIVRNVLRAFSVRDTIAFFRDAGVALHEEANGKLFPDTNRARDVLDALLRSTSEAGVLLAGGQRVRDIVRVPAGFLISTDTDSITARAVVLATGGESLPKTGSDGWGLAMARRLGHTIVPTTPALVPLVLDAGRSIHRELSGVSHDVEIGLRVDEAIAIRVRGALLWTHFGISGPAALDASRHWLRARIENRRASMAANMCPGRTFDDVDRDWQRHAQSTPRASVRTTLAGVVPAAVAVAILSRLDLAGDTPLAHLAREQRRQIARALVEWPLPVTDSRGYAHAEATAGGVALTEIDPSTMASRVCDGLWIAGEMLDVDGRLGGFNFQWAWSSGFVAGRALARAGRT